MCVFKDFPGLENLGKNSRTHKSPAWLTLSWWHVSAVFVTDSSLPAQLSGWYTEAGLCPRQCMLWPAGKHQESICASTEHRSDPVSAAATKNKQLQYNKCHFSRCELKGVGGWTIPAKLSTPPPALRSIKPPGTGFWAQVVFPNKNPSRILIAIHS